MIANIEQFYTEGKIVVERLNTFFRELGITSFVQADHICFKCESSDEFESMRKMFEQHASYFFQSIISQRRIAVVKFLEPLETIVGPIGVLELSDQKPDASQKSGFDHIEIYPREKTVEDIIKILEQKGVVVTKESRPHHTTWDFFVEGFRVRIEECPLIEKIKQEEMI